jgi:hypothetical protein
MKTISKSEVLPLINSTKGRFFTVSFVKADGAKRRLTGRVGVSKGVKGTGFPMGADAAQKYRTVWDSANLEFRKVNLTTVYKLVINKETYEVV